MLVALTADGREGHRVRPLPDLTAEAWDSTRGHWRRNRHSAERLLKLYGGGWPRGFNMPPVRNPSFAPPFASEPVRWSEREGGQYLMPFFPDSPDAYGEFAAARVGNAGHVPRDSVFLPPGATFALPAPVKNG